MEIMKDANARTTTLENPSANASSQSTSPALLAPPRKIKYAEVKRREHEEPPRNDIKGYFYTRLALAGLNGAAAGDEGASDGGNEEIRVVSSFTFGVNLYRPSCYLTGQPFVFNGPEDNDQAILVEHIAGDHAEDYTNATTEEL